MVICTSCGCSWDDTGYYYCKGRVQQPCIECRKDAKSIDYLNKRDSILEAQRTAYYTDHEATKAYYREYRRAKRAETAA
jgi:hypothetical protein